MIPINKLYTWFYHLPPPLYTLFPVLAKKVAIHPAAFSVVVHVQVVLCAPVVVGIKYAPIRSVVVTPVIYELLHDTRPPFVKSVPTPAITNSSAKVVAAVVPDDREVTVVPPSTVEAVLSNTEAVSVLNPLNSK